MPTKLKTKISKFPSASLAQKRALAAQGTMSPLTNSLYETALTMLCKSVNEAADFGELHTGLLWQQVYEELKINPRSISPITIEHLKRILNIELKGLGYDVKFQQTYSIVLQWQEKKVEPNVQG